MTTSISRLLAVCAGLAMSASACTSEPGITLSAPGKVQRALDVVSDLAATATLVKSGGSRLDDVILTRGDDGVTFSGFIDAEPGQYTLEIVFSGDALGARHFLGRLTSDSFTVTSGAQVTPEFSQGLDTVGLAGDGGDDDEDGLGFLDELLLGTDVNAADSDGDGLEDGDDCVPDDDNSNFAIAEGGSFLDCDADGFITVTVPFGDPGEDCDDENGDVHPGVDDNCGNDLDEDCNPQTCPIADFEGPEVEIVSPAAGATIGCTAQIVVEASDPSDVTNVFAKAPDDPLNGGFDRVVSLVAADDGLTWRAPNGFGFTGAALDDGPFDVDVTAIDTAANQTTVSTSFTLLSVYPEVTMTGPDSIVDAPADITVTPVAGGRTLTVLELRAAPFNAATFQLELGDEVVVASLPASGGTATVQPDVLPGDFVVYPVAVDDIGNAAAPLALGASFNVQTGVTSGFFCDGVTHFLPGIPKRAGGLGPITLLEKLDEATALVLAEQPTAFLTQVIAFGVDDTGHIDLSRTDLFSFVKYSFMTPEAIASLGDNAEGPAVYYYTAAFQLESPTLDPDDSFLQDEIANPSALIDSDVVAAQFTCGGNGLRGLDDDMVIYDRDVDGAIPNTDVVAVFTADGFSWTTDATNLNDPDGFCCTPDGCS